MVRNKTENFVYSLFFPAILGLTTLLFWVANLSNVGLTIVCFAGIFVFSFFEDLTPAFPPLLLLGMTFRDSQTFSQNTFALIIVGLFTLSIVFNLIKYPFKKVKFDLIACAICIIALTMLLSEVFSPNKQAFSLGLPFFSTTCVSTLLVHFLTTNRVKHTKKHDRVKIFCYFFLFAINTACLEMLYAILHDSFIDNLTFQIPGGFAWANTNHVANMILIAVPVCFYLISKTKNVYPLFCELVFLYVCCFASQSDGCLAILILFTPLLCLKTYSNIMAHNKTSFIWFCLKFFAVCLVALFFCLYFVPAQTQEFFDKMLNDSARAPIYVTAWELFISSPIIGVGLGNSAFICGTEYTGLFHSTLFQMLAACGILGVLSFALLYYARLKSLSKNESSFCSFVILATVMFICYGLIDNGEFNIVVVYLTALISFALTQNKKAEKEYSLPIYKKFNLFS